jgi:hypothetical protein
VIDEPTLEELEREQSLRVTRRAVAWSRTVAVAALFAAVALIFAGRSLWWHLIGYVLAALVATSAMAYAARRASTLRRFDDTASVARVIVFNVACLVVAFVHMLYVARRFW